ncbi:hypothetical protein CA54_25870 [Symmachiella macrocystis]|uniref:DUF1571 domain-containing protein n=1 Tax=Symmachiella macrocystis TaxID=2527985 RepID=A0A5C6BPY2_9PLAN|nr:DUF1571 domain-containing protein [Symmachiella macrocystis]TWU13752.1 hypothetical protein CA54_25870 [Symmachiella macrocystis]
MTLQHSSPIGRSKPRRLRILMLLSTICILGVIVNTHRGSQRPVADPHDFRKASRRAAAVAPIAKASNSDILQVSVTEQTLQSTTAQPVAVEAQQDPQLHALQTALTLLQNGRDRLKSINHYTATFIKQERVGDELTEGDVTEIKVRHEPFSVYMKWVETDAGQEMLYADGVNDGNLLLKQVGWKSRLLPVISLDPHCVLAMSQSRYPVTQMGLLRLVETLITDRRNDIEKKTELKCQLFDDEVCHERPCYRFVLEYGSQQVSATYRKSDLFIDKELSVPVQIANFTWPDSDWGADWGCEEMDDETLIEYYGYCDLVLGTPLSDLDFDRSNEEYGFQKD